MNNIKKELLKANKYDDVLTVLEEYMENTKGNCPVGLYINDDGTPSYDVMCKDVAEQAEWLFKILTTDDNIDNSDFRNLGDLFKAIKSALKMMTNNFVVSLSHRHTPTISMTKLRTYLILDNLLSNKVYACDWDEESDWTIPDGWKRTDFD